MATVCISASIGFYSNSGGQAWLYLDWALGLQEIGCDVIWLEADHRKRREPIEDYIVRVRRTLDGVGLNCRVALCAVDGTSLPSDSAGIHLSLDEAAEAADLYLNLAYNSHPEVLRRFRKTAFVDQDPGAMQVWISTDYLKLPPHDFYVTTGETVGTPHAKFPDCGLPWIRIRPPIALSAWPVCATPNYAPFTTVSNWRGQSVAIDGRLVPNDKRTSFLPFVTLPSETPAALELALCLVSPEDDADRQLLEDCGWRVRLLADNPWTADGPWTIDDYRRYVQSSRGEFTCAKPLYVKLETAILHDRTLHYLASGKPAVVQHTGPSHILPDAAGLFRFRTLDEARCALETICADYERQCRLARQLTEEVFDARRVLRGLLERLE